MNVLFIMLFISCSTVITIFDIITGFCTALQDNCHFNTSSTILVSILSLYEGADEDLLSRSSDGKRGKAIIQSVTKNFQLKNIFIFLLLSKLSWKVFGPVAKS
jgi:hypothetical protein